MSEELKPCPFCGGQASIKIHDFFDDTRLYTPKCKCGAGIVEVFHTEAEAVAAWNTRTERTCRNELWDGFFKCSECGLTVSDSEYFPLATVRYCPQCGARVVER